MRARAALVAGWLLACSAPAPTPTPPPGPSDLADRARARLSDVAPELVAIRHDIHAHPELAGAERRTAELIAARLEALGLRVRRGVGGHGVVAVIEGGRPGPVVAYRADMDAVRSADPDPAAFRSQVPGVRHICGHDVHVAVGLGVAEALAAVRPELPGTVVLLFQPAEETASGAAAMIAGGALRTPEPRAIFAVHSAPLPVGTVGTVDGLFLPGLGLLEIAITGDGDRDRAAGLIAADVAALTNVAAADPLAPVRGDAVVAQLAGVEPAAGRTILRALVRALRPGDRDRAVDRLRAAIAARELAGLSIEVRIDDAIPPTINDRDLVRASLAPLRAALGDAGVVEINQPIPFFSEDFAFYLARTPGAMYWLGVSAPDRGIVGLPHSPGFAADDRSIEIGAAAMVAVLLDHLGRPEAARGSHAVARPAGDPAGVRRPEGSAQQ